MRTYERGVEDETLSCGTGVVAAALITSVKKNVHERQDHSVKIFAPGGDFEVTFFRADGNKFSNIWLTGGAAFVFNGEIEI